MSQLHIQILGNPHIVHSEQQIKIKSRKALALLVYLAVTQRQHSREALAALLWGNLPGSKARVNLRKALSELRHQVNAYMQIEHRTAAFASNRPHTVDLHQLEQAVGQLRQMSAWDDQTTQHDQFLSALPITLLEGFRVRNAPDFDEWLRWQQLIVHEQMIAGYQQLARLATEAERHERAVYYLRQILRLQPWQEVVHQQLMRTLWAQGERTAALKQYETCVTTLEEELGVLPEPETVALYEQILVGQHKRARPTEATAVSNPPVVAREPELARLQTLLLNPDAEVKLAFVIGEAGSGKTALMQAFVQQRPSMLVLTGCCNAFSGSGDAFLPFREMLTSLFAPAALPAPIDLFDICLRLGSQLLNTLLPAEQLSAWAAHHWAEDVQRRQQAQAQLDAALAEAQAPAGQQGVLFAQLTAVLGAVAAQYPLLLLIDDLQWLDHGSVDLLFHLCRALPTHSFGLLGAYRPEDVSANEPHPIQPLLHELRRQFGDVVVNLDVIPKRPFVDAYLDQVPNALDEQFRQTLLAQTSGHPLFTVELLRTMQEQGSLRPDEAGVLQVSKTLAWNQIPPRVEGVIGERVGRLPPALQRLLQVAAVEGERFTAEVAAAVLGRDPAAVLLALSQTVAKQHQLVVAEGVSRQANGRLSRYRFRHILIQKYLYEQLDAVERVHWHEQVAEVMVRLHDDPDQIALPLARHYERAQGYASAIRYLYKAAVQAVHRYAHQAAIALIEEALGMLDALESGRVRDLLELDLLMLIGPILITKEGFSSEAGHQVYLRADLLNQLAPNNPNQFVILSGLWLYHIVKGDMVKATNYSRQLLDASSKGGGSKEKIAAHYAMIASHFFQGQFEETSQYALFFDKIYQVDFHRELFQRFGADPGLASICYQSFSLALLGYSKQAIDHAEKVLSLNQKIGNPVNLAYALSHVGLVHHICLDASQTLDFSEEAVFLATKHGVKQWWATSMVINGWAYVHLGKLEKGLKRIEEGIYFLRDVMGNDLAMTHYLWVLADAVYAAGDWEKSFKILDEAIGLANRGGRFWLSAALNTKGEWLLAAGASEREVTNWFSQAIDVARHQKAKLLELRAANSWAGFHLDRGRPEAAVALLEPLLNWFTEGHNMAELQRAQLLLAQAKQR